MTTASPRILIVRLSAIGDVIHGLPVLNALREAHPQSFLGWVVESPAAPLLRGHEALDCLFEVPRGWLKSPPQVLRLRKELRDKEFDISIDLQGLTKSGVVGWLCGAKRRLGFAGADAREISSWFYTESIDPKAGHVVDRCLQLLRPLRITSPQASFNLPRDAEAEAKAHSLIGDRDLNNGFAVVNPGAGWPSKRWPRPRYAAVARHIGQKHSLPVVVVWAGAEERGWAEEIVAEAGGQAGLAPPTSLVELASLLRRARIFVGSDTGPLHIAAAVGTPCVGLYGPMPAERNGPYGPGHVALQEMRLAGSSRARRRASTESMEAISVEQVCTACDKLLEEVSAGCS